MAQFFTRCPHCHMAFRISHAQLRVAEGFARCGACNELFSAEDHRLPETPSLEELISEHDETLSPVENDQADATSNDLLIDEDLSLEKLLNDQSEEFPSATRSANTSYFESGHNPKKDLSLDHLLNDTEQGLNSDSKDSDQPSIHSTSTEEELGEEIDNELSNTTESPSTNYIVEEDLSFDQLLAQDRKAPEAEEDTSTETLTTEDETHTPPPSINKEKNDIKSDENAENDDNDTSNSTIIDTPKEQTHSEAVSDFSAEFIDSLESNTTSTHSGFARSTAVSPTSGVEYIDHESLITPSHEEEIALPPLDTPVELVTSDLKIDKRKSLHYSLACLFCTLILGAQYFLYNIESFIEDSDSEGMLSWACSILTCPPPQTSDIGAIRSEELSIRTHPQIEGALLVTFIFRNNASFEQAFPLAELVFSNQRNRVLASRLFTPEEYLPDELQQFQDMPANTPIQAELEIADPGEDAINYILQFRPR